MDSHRPRPPVQLGCRFVDSGAPTRLGRDANDAASGAGAGIASLLGLGVVRLAEVISAGVDDEGALWSREPLVFAFAYWRKT